MRIGADWSWNCSIGATPNTPAILHRFVHVHMECELVVMSWQHPSPLLYPSLMSRMNFVSDDSFSTTATLSSRTAKNFPSVSRDTWWIVSVLLFLRSKSRALRSSFTCFFPEPCIIMNESTTSNERCCKATAGCVISDGQKLVSITYYTSFYIILLLLLLRLLLLRRRRMLLPLSSLQQPNQKWHAYICIPKKGNVSNTCLTFPKLLPSCDFAIQMPYLLHTVLTVANFVYPACYGVCPAGFAALTCFKIELPVQGGCSYWRHFLAIFDDAQAPHMPYRSNRKNMTIELNSAFDSTAQGIN